MHTLSYNSTLQFLNLAGNKVHLEKGEYRKITNNKKEEDAEFEQSLLAFLETNVKNLTHLDIRDMGYEFDFAKIFEHMKLSKSLQVFHFDSSRCDAIQQFDVEQKGIEMLKEQMVGYMSCADKNVMEFVEKSGVAHLLEPVGRNRLHAAHVVEGVLSQAVKEMIKSKRDTSEAWPEKHGQPFLMMSDPDAKIKIDAQNQAKAKPVEVEARSPRRQPRSPRADESQAVSHAGLRDPGTADAISARQGDDGENVEKASRQIPLVDYIIGWKELGATGSKIKTSHTLSRELCKGSYRTKILYDNGQLKQSFKAEQDWNSNWSLDAEPCKYCHKLQYVHVYFNRFKDGQEISEDFSRIERPEIIRLLERYLPKQSEENGPVVFGSLTNWQILSMTPIQIYTVNLLLETLETKLPRCAEIAEDFASGLCAEKLGPLLAGFSSHLACFDYARSQIHYEFFQQVHQVGSRSSRASDGFMIQALVAPGKHSVIVHDPRSGGWYCTQVLVDAFRGRCSLEPSLEVPKSIQLLDAADSLPPLSLPRPSDFDLGKERHNILSFLEDMKPRRFKTEQNVNLKSLQELFANYDKINALFESLATRSNSRHIVTPPKGDQLQATADPANEGAEERPSEPAITPIISPGNPTSAQQHSQESISHLSYTSKNDPTASPRTPKQHLLPSPTTIPLSDATSHFNCTSAQHQLLQELGNHLNREQFLDFVFHQSLLGLDIEPLLNIE